MVCAIKGIASPYSYLAVGATNQDSQVVKDCGGVVSAIMAFTTNAVPVYVKLYDQATLPTASDTPVQRLMLPANTSGAGFVMAFPLVLGFNNGIAHRICGGLADADTTPVSSGAVLNLTYE